MYNNQRKKEESAKKQKVLLLEDKKWRKSREEIGKRIRKLVREINKIESENGKNSTNKSIRLREEVKRLRKEQKNF
jgi:hypothetical protein